MYYENLYSELGKLLYAVADIDGVISEQEKKEIHEIVAKELVPAEEHEDAYGSNTAYYTEMEFDFLDEEIGDAETALNSFIDYVTDHHTAIDQRMKNVVIHVTERLAKAYYGTNKKELKLIEKLKSEMDKIQFKK